MSPERAYAEEPVAGIMVASTHTERLPERSLNGWNYLAVKLIERKVPEKKVYEILSDPRMPIREPVYFKVFPRESRVLYRKHNSARNRKHAREFYAQEKEWLTLAEKRYGVPATVLLALLQVETSCGRHVGRERVFPRLARLAAIAEPKNLESNIEEQRKRGDEANPALVTKRGKYLEETFLPHLVSSIRFAEDLGIHPLDLRGSSGGAIGIPQFLPGNVYTFGADGDGDGKIDLFRAPDAIFSTARFLAESGWKGKMSHGKQKQVLLQYNRSNAYADTILAMAGQLRRELFETKAKGTTSSKIVKKQKANKARARKSRGRKRAQ